jgi:hypothetical protein
LNIPPCKLRRGRLAAPLGLYIEIPFERLKLGRGRLAAPLGLYIEIPFERLSVFLGVCSRRIAEHVIFIEPVAERDSADNKADYEEDDVDDRSPTPCH